jgi:hypothetical protein
VPGLHVGEARLLQRRDRLVERADDDREMMQPFAALREPLAVQAVAAGRLDELELGRSAREGKPHRVARVDAAQRHPLDVVGAERVASPLPVAEHRRVALDRVVAAGDDDADLVHRRCARRAQRAEQALDHHAISLRS